MLHGEFGQPIPLRLISLHQATHESEYRAHIGGILVPISIETTTLEPRNLANLGVIFMVESQAERAPSRINAIYGLSYSVDFNAKSRL
jgi:hypothetical protein